MTAYEKLEYLEEIFTTEDLYRELILAIEVDELKNCLDYIARMWDIDFEESEGN